MRKTGTFSRLLRAVGVIILIGIMLAFWQFFAIAGLAFLIWVYAADQGSEYPRTYMIITFPFKLIFGKSK